MSDKPRTDPLAVQRAAREFAQAELPDHKYARQAARGRVRNSVPLWRTKRGSRRVSVVADYGGLAH